MYKYFTLILTIALLCGCASFTPDARPDSPIEMPLQFSMYGEEDNASDCWWEAFNSRELNRLVQTALSGNFDVKTALARLQQADAVSRQAGAELIPTVDYKVSGDIAKSRTKTSSDSAGRTSEDQNWYTGLAASYEVDLWGRLDAERQSEALNVQAAKEDLASAKMTVTASVVEAWIDILSTRKQIAVLKDQIKTNETLLELEKLRFVNGKAYALDVSQQREALTAAKAQMPTLQMTERQLLSSLAILLGKATYEDLNTEKIDLPDLIPLPDVGVPADLLAARPDVRAAGFSPEFRRLVSGGGAGRSFTEHYAFRRCGFFKRRPGSVI